MTNRGFSLIELAVILVLAGLISTAGLFMLPKLWHEKQRVETRKYLDAAKDSLLVYATTFYALPAHVAEDPEQRLLPTTTLRLKQTDAFGNHPRYLVNSKLLPGADKTLPCATLKAYFANGTATDFPLLWRHGMPEVAGTGIPVAAVLLSAGANGLFDPYEVDLNGSGLIEAGETIGDNSTGNPYVLAPETATFDDLAIPVTISELLAALPECQL